MTAISSSCATVRPTPAERINQQIHQQQNLSAGQAAEGKNADDGWLKGQAPSAERQAGARAAAVANGRGRAAQLAADARSGARFPGPKLGIDDLRRPATDGTAEDAARDANAPARGGGATAGVIDDGRIGGLPIVPSPDKGVTPLPGIIDGSPGVMPSPMPELPGDTIGVMPSPMPELPGDNIGLPVVPDRGLPRRGIGFRLEPAPETNVDRINRIIRGEPAPAPLLRDDIALPTVR